MSEVQKFATPLAGAEIEMVKIDGESLFSVPSLARALEYSNTHKAMRHLPAKHIRKIPNRALGRSEGGHDVPFTTEAGLYRLILRSNMPKAEEFTDWVTEELLPTVRKAQGVGIDALAELKERVAKAEWQRDKHLEARQHAEVEAGDFLEEHLLLENGFVRVRTRNGRLKTVRSYAELKNHRNQLASVLRPV